MLSFTHFGNQLADSRKGLQFCYNLANLPSKVEGMSGSGNAGLTLNYGYLSDGTKASAIAETAAGSGAEGLKYRGSFVYETVPVPGSEDGEEILSSIGWSEGRIAFDNPFEVAADSAAVEAVSLPEGLTVRLLAHGGVEEPGDTTETAASLLGTMHDLWYIADHLGNVRAVVDMTFGGFVAESNEYLPFGTRLDGTLALPENRYRLGGKEEQRFGGLDLALSDFGARFYDPFTARWTTRDPLAGKYHSLSPYNYCGGNPVNLVDPDGRKIVVGGNVTYKNKVYAAINHMSAHGVGRVIDHLNDSKETYTIVPDAINSYSFKSRTISWNPDYMKLDESGKIMHSPTVSLAHELGHAENHDRNEEMFKADSNEEDAHYVTVEEKNVIEGIEQDTARALGEISSGEVTRTSHGGQYGPNVANLSPKSQSDKAFMFNHPLIRIPDTAFPLPVLMK